MAARKPPGPASPTRQADREQVTPDRAAMLEASASNARTRQKAKEDLDKRNAQAHKRAQTQLAARDALRRDLRKGLEF